MNDTNIKPFASLHSEASSQPKRMKATGKSVTIRQGNKLEVQFGAEGPQVRLAAEVKDALVRDAQLEAAPRMPKAGTPQEKLLLISLLGLKPEQVARIESNAAALKMSFTQALAAEIDG